MSHGSRYASCLLLFCLCLTGAAAQKNSLVQEVELVIPYAAPDGTAGFPKTLDVTVPGAGYYCVSVEADEDAWDETGTAGPTPVSLTTQAIRKPSGQKYNRVQWMTGQGFVSSQIEIRLDSDLLRAEFRTSDPDGTRGVLRVQRAEVPLRNMRLFIPHSESDGVPGDPARYEFVVTEPGKYSILLEVDRTSWSGPVSADLVPIEMTARGIETSTASEYNAAPWTKWLGNVSVPIVIRSEEDRIVVEFSTTAPLGARGVLTILELSPGPASAVPVRDRGPIGCGLPPGTGLDPKKTRQ